MSGGNTHEPSSQGHSVKMGSDRGFGLVFAAVFALIGVWPALKLGWIPRLDPASLRLWALAIAGAFLGLAFAAPALLNPLNRLWFAFGLLLGKVMTPVVMGLLYALTIVPTGLHHAPARQGPADPQDRPGAQVLLDRARAAGACPRHHVEPVLIAARSPIKRESVPVRILGISAFYHDSAAALVVDGEIVAAAQEERFTRRKHDAALSRPTR